MQSEIEASAPKFIGETHIFTSWLIRPQLVMYIFSWMDNYLLKHNSLVGVADIISTDLTVYKWDEDSANYKVLWLEYLLHL